MRSAWVGTLDQERGWTGESVGTTTSHLSAPRGVLEAGRQGTHTSAGDLRAFHLHASKAGYGTSMSICNMTTLAFVEDLLKLQCGSINLLISSAVIPGSASWPWLAEYASLC